MKKKAIDISYYQGSIDFEKVKNSGIEAVIIREGYRNSIDKKFFEYVEQAKKAGLEIFGIYHFSYALNETQAKDEADLTITNAILADLDPEKIYIFYDFEYDTVKKAAALGINLGRAECNAHTEAFCKRLESLGCKPGIYTNLDYHKNWYDRDLLQKYAVWLADYTGDPDFDCLVQQYSNVGSVPGISGNVDLDYIYDFNFKINEDQSKKYSRSEVVALANSWIGKNEADGSYKSIIDIYNSLGKNYPRGTKMQYDWSWCACTWSAIAIQLGYLDIMPIEISCGYLIEAAKKMGCWEERDDYVPKPGDGILYDWDDNGNGDNIGWPDHVGVVTAVSGNTITVVEGNKSDAVGIRTMSVNGKYIRGFITPKYDEEVTIVKKSAEEIAREVLDGKWSKGQERKDLLTKAGYDYSEVQTIVNRIVKDQQIKEEISRIHNELISHQSSVTSNCCKNIGNILIFTISHGGNANDTSKCVFHVFSSF